MNNIEKILGEIRASDQIIRINQLLNNNKLFIDKSEAISNDEVYSGRSIYIHEWSHYFQFSLTPVGIMISKLRRENLLVLLELIEELREAEMPKMNSVHFNEKALAIFKKYQHILEVISSVWKPWPESWLLGNTIKTVKISPYGLRVSFVDNKSIVELPLGPSQVFEAWASIEEKIHSKNREFQIDYAAENLIHTWPLHVLISIIGVKDFEENRFFYTWDMLSLLIACSFYERWAWEIHPLSESPIAKELIKKNTSTARVLFQFFRNIKRYIGEDSKKEGFLIAFDKYIKQSGLPPISDCIKELKNGIETLMQIMSEHFEEDLRDRQKTIFDKTVFSQPYETEREILNISVQNLKILEENLYETLTNPFANSGKYERPLVALFNGRYYEWRVINDLYHSDDKFDFNKLYRRQGGYTFFEHIVYQLLFSEHLACYGSIFWQHPIEECDHVDECLQTKNKCGINFCKNFEWRGLVFFYIEMLANTYSKGILPKGIAGLDQLKEEVYDYLRKPS